MNVVLAPAPFVADKVEDSKDKIWNEFLRLIGVANVSFQKKERAIRDEILALQGGTIASRFSRYEPREKAILEINKKFAKNLTYIYIVHYKLPNFKCFFKLYIIIYHKKRKQTNPLSLKITF